jgi:oligosaccharide repeat unit polymerase
VAVLLGGIVLMLVLPFPVYSAIGVLTLLIVALSLCLMQRAVGLFDFRRMTIPGFAYLVYFLVIVLPGFGIYGEEVEPYRTRYLFSVESALITIPLGMILAGWLMGFRKDEIRKYFAAQITPEPMDRAAMTAFVVFLSFSCGVALLHASQVATVPLLYALRHPGDWLEAATLREDSFKLLESSYTYLFYVVRGTFFPFLVMMSFGLYQQCKKRGWLLIFAASLITALVYAAMTIEKSPVATLILMLFLFFYLFKGGRISKKLLICGPIAFLAFPLLMILLIYSGEDTGTMFGALGAIWNRFFRGPTEVLYYYFEVFPDLVPFQHGASIGKLAAIMGWNTVNIPNIVAMQILGSEGNVLPSATANACFLGTWNADFGLTGILFGGLLAGLSMQLAQIAILRRPKSISNLSIYAFLMVVFAMLSSVPLTVVLVSDGAIFIFILSWLMKWSAMALRKPSRRLLSPNAV